MRPWRLFQKHRYARKLIRRFGILGARKQILNVAKKETSMLRACAFALFVAFVPIGAASSKAEVPPIEANPEIVETLHAIGTADRLRRQCSSVEGRVVKAYFELRRLENRAKEMGYTTSNIEDLLANEAAKDELEKRILAELSGRGAAPKDTAAHCAIANEEILRKTPVGRLLR